MSMHTPGPWQYRPHKYDDWGWVRGGVPDEDGYLPLVACARSGAFDATDYPAHRSNKTDPFEANARLIAAAPDLLAALKVAEQFIANGIEFGYIRMPDQGTPDPAHETPRLIREAIAKAEGRA
jgi:hypothetical protein